MILISHRGNINGSNPDLENSPNYIQKALDLGYNVEIDVWGWKYGGYSLGHDNPQYNVDVEFLRQDGLWCHAKDMISYYRMMEDPHIHCFAHDSDMVALTSKGYFWQSWNFRLTKRSICVMPPKYKEVPDYVAGICSDEIERYK